MPSISFIYPIYDSPLKISPIPSISFTYPIYDALNINEYITCFHWHAALRGCFPGTVTIMLLHQCVSLRTVCIRRLVRIGRQGLRLLRCFCLCGEHACLCARCFVRVCMSVLAARCLLLARCEYVCCLYYVYVCDMLASRCVLTWTGVWYLREWAYGKTGCAVYVI